MRIEVKPINQMGEQRNLGIKPFAVDLHLTDRMVRLGTFVQAEPEAVLDGFYVKDLYRANKIERFLSAEDAAHAIAECQMGRHIADLVPIHLGMDVPT